VGQSTVRHDLVAKEQETMTSGQTSDVNLSIPADMEIEPMLLLDVTGSMAEAADPSGSISRRDLVGQAISTIVRKLEVKDSQAEHEEDAGGLMTITFANGEATSIEDLSSANLRQKWSQIRWGGGTYIVPGWNELVDTYNEEFGTLPPEQKPALLALIITDGEAKDIDQFTQILAQARGGVYIVVALLGYGTEHDRAAQSWQQVAQQNPGHVGVVSFASQTNPDVIADTLVEMIS
jgi:hypothetical protein